MPPKYKFTREEIIRAALDLTREKGSGAVTARALGERLGASSRPVFSVFQSMQEVQQEVIAAADSLYLEYIKHDMASGMYPPYKASGMAYIRFACEETELFKLLFMRDRKGEPIAPGREMDEIIPLIMKNTCLSLERAQLFHLEMWVFVHGIASMIATSYLDWKQETISDVLTDAYMGLKARFLEKEGHGSGRNQNG